MSNELITTWIAEEDAMYAAGYTYDVYNAAAVRTERERWSMRRKQAETVGDSVAAAYATSRWVFAK